LNIRPHNGPLFCPGFSGKNSWRYVAFFGSIGLFISQPSCAKIERNDNTHLVKEQNAMDFLSESFVNLPNNSCMQQILRFGYIHSVFLFAIEHRLGEIKELSNKERVALLHARSVFKQGLAPFLPGFPIANSVFGTTDLWQELEEKKRAYQMRP